MRASPAHSHQLTTSASVLKFYLSTAYEMGQNFYIVSPSTHEVLPGYGKLGEILFNGAAKLIVEVLAVPVRPVISA
jgi:hypothetical protein